MIKTLSKSIREYKWASILSPIFISLEVLMEVIIPFVLAMLIDEGINFKNSAGETVGNTENLIKYGLFLVGCCLLSLLFGFLAGDFAAKASTGFAHNLRKDMFYSIQNYSFKNIDKFSTSSLITRLTTDVTNIQNSYQMLIRIAIRSPLMIIFSLTMAFYISPKLGSVFLYALPLMVAVLLLIMRFTFPLFEKMFKIYDKLNRVVQENLRGIRVVKSFVREDTETQKFHTVSKDIYNISLKAERLIAFAAPLMQFTVYSLMLIVSWIGAKLIVDSNGTALDAGELTSMFTYTMQILMNFMMLSMVFVMLIMSRASGKRIVEVLREVPDLHNRENPVYEIKDGSIEFENVSFSYSGESENLCLEDISFKINPGETVGIIGSTGSSKTTLVSLIPRLYDVTKGRITVGGVDVKDYDLEALRDAVSMVLQKNVLFSGTIKENLRWGNENATDDEIIHACRLACADEFISTFPEGYDTYIEEGGTNVSGGQKQRLCIARALLKSPKILILDDSTSAVDTATDSNIQKAMAGYIPETTKIIIAQRISSVEHADKIIVLDDGKISAIGTHEQLLESSEIYSEVYTSQQKGGLK
ncbi:MAG: ABC transporter ATP-binding protein [Eubacteriales bacterium]|nr:ABC transporter ATP-binding protein [Eubacteriales bacterium]